MKNSILKESLRISREKLPSHPWREHKKCHFSFIVQDNKMIEWGMNRRGNPPISYPEFAAIHSEVDAFRKAKGILNHNREFEIINIRLNPLGEMRMSAPCVRCGPFIRAIGCANVWFTTNNGVFAKMKL